MKYKIVYLTLVVISVLFFMSCATVVRGGKSDIYITSDPSGLEIEITEINTGEVIFKGNTPKAIVLPKKSGYFKKASYDIVAQYPNTDSVTVRLEADKLNIKAYIIGNIFSGNIFGWFLVDPLTGAMFEWTPLYVREGNGKISGLVIKKEGSIKITHKDAVEIEASKQTEDEFDF